MDKVITFAPASVGNVGPCYDIMGYALDFVGDFVTLEKIPLLSPNDIQWVGVEGPHASSLKQVDFRQNTAWVVANHLWTEFAKSRRNPFSLRLTLHKFMPIGSGLGSSAASAVAAAKALLSLLDLSIGQDDLIAALELGEEVSSGTGYPDNVVPSYFGGFHVIFEERDSSGNGSLIERRTTKLIGGDGLVSIVVRPNITVTTRESRQKVRDYIKQTYLEPPGVEPADILRLVREQSAKAAEMVRAFVANDIRRVGEILNKNPLLENARSSLIPGFFKVKQAALNAGAFGCTIAGAGPALVAITDDPQTAQGIKEAMVQAFDPRFHPQWVISPLNQRGSEVIDSVEQFIQRTKSHHSFF